MSTYLLYPSVRFEDGIGHIIRMIRLHEHLDNSCLYIPEKDYDPLMQRIPTLKDCCVVHALGNVGNNDLIVLDMPWVDDEVLRDLQSRAPLLAIDLGGRGRVYAPFLIDTLPYPGYAAHRHYFGKYHHEPRFPGVAYPSPARSPARAPENPNIFEPGLLPLPPTASMPPAASMPHTPEKRREVSSDIRNILVTFGGSDPSGLTRQFVRYLRRSKLLASLSGKIVLMNSDHAPYADPLNAPQNARRRELPRGWEYVPPASSLTASFNEADLCICSYGLSAWEAQYAGVKTVVIPSSFYHQKLARMSGFLSLPIRKIEKLKYPRLRERLIAQVHRVQALELRSLAEVISSMGSPRASACPCCGNTQRNAALSRSPNRSYFRCSSCATIYVQSMSASAINYDRQYFFEHYEQQYGKTYLEDFDHIQSMGTERMRVIGKIAKPTRPPQPVLPQQAQQAQQQRLLDIGCAFGPFMAAASAAGYRAEGTDINKEATDYVRKELQLHARHGDIANEAFRRSFDPECYDVVTMWYVIEHFPDLTQILPWIHKILKGGGVFAISTPNSMGISGRSNLSAFLQQGPEDHYSVWNQIQAAQLARRYGFRLKFWKSVGHHGERFPGILGSKQLRRFSAALSKVLSLGDGLEAYFIKD